LFDPGSVQPLLLDPVSRVVGAIREKAPGLADTDIMLMGAVCRDVVHAALGHAFLTRKTGDLDLALALRSWDAFDALAAEFPTVSDTGVRFRVCDVDVDLLPFGDVEVPAGSVSPPTRRESMSVWAFDELHAAALPLQLPGGVTIRIPTVPGYVAAKLGAWLDRSAYGEYRDAGDLALAMWWYSESQAIIDRLYGESSEILTAESFDVDRSAARLLGCDVMATIGHERGEELLRRWPDRVSLLQGQLRVGVGIPAVSWPSATRAAELVEALARGLMSLPAA
jgi:predicted nucleotidyltransferase